MNELTPEMILKIDALISAFGVLMGREDERRMRDIRIEEDLKAIRDILPIPDLVGHTWACEKMGISYKTGQLHPELLPEKVRDEKGKVIKPIKYVRSEVIAKIAAFKINPTIRPRMRKGRAA